MRLMRRLLIATRSVSRAGVAGHKVVWIELHYGPKARA
jgi:hypothetical protein